MSVKTKVKKEKPLAVVILAAGKGSRMKSDTPKVLHKIAGLAMINHVVNVAESLNPAQIITVLAPDMKDVAQAVASHTVAIQKEANGTGGALRAAMPALKGFKGNVVVLLGDVPLITMKTVRALIKAKGQDVSTGLSVLGVDLPNPSGYGRLVMNKQKILEQIVEEKDATKAQKTITVINSGAFCLDGARLERWVKKLNKNNAQGEYYITDLPAIAAKDKAVTKVAMASDADEVRGCNTRQDLASLEAIMQNRLRDAAMAKGVTMLEPSSVYLSHDTKLGKDVLLEPHIFFGPKVQVAVGTHIKAFSHFEDCKIGKNGNIGPFARLRPGADLAEDVKIGNFVEIKKSKIGKRSKINHLGYVGDTTMGADVNFSAGAITVNYDGFEKHQTIIGDGVMVGSNVNLVAPLSIDNGAFIAAGSTITEDVPADALSIARDAHKIREGWAAEYRKKKQAILRKLKRAKKTG